MFVDALYLKSIATMFPGTQARFSIDLCVIRKRLLRRTLLVTKIKSEGRGSILVNLNSLLSVCSLVFASFKFSLLYSYALHSSTLLCKYRDRIHNMSTHDWCMVYHSVSQAIIDMPSPRKSVTICITNWPNEQDL